METGTLQTRLRKKQFIKNRKPQFSVFSGTGEKSSEQFKG